MSDRIAVFNRGRIEQVGTPADVYERPATAFVAGSGRRTCSVARSPSGSSADPGRSRSGRRRSGSPTRPSCRRTSATGRICDVIYLGSILAT